MARPMKALPENGTPAAEFAEQLRALRDRAGRPTMTAMARRSGVSAASLSLAHAGVRIPTWPVTRAYVTACRGNVQAWRARWEQARTLTCPCPLSGQEDTYRRVAQGRRVTPPSTLTTSRDLAAFLDLVRRGRGLSLRTIAQHGSYYSHHTYGAILRGDRPLTVHALRGVLTACRLADGPTLAQWLIALARVQPDQARDAEALLRVLRQTPRQRPKYRILPNTLTRVSA